MTEGKSQLETEKNKKERGSTFVKSEVRVAQSCLSQKAPVGGKRGRGESSRPELLALSGSNSLKNALNLGPQTFRHRQNVFPILCDRYGHHRGRQSYRPESLLLWCY